MYYSASSKRLPLFSAVSMRNLALRLTPPVPKMYKRLRMRLSPELHERDVGIALIGQCVPHVGGMRVTRPSGRWPVPLIGLRAHGKPPAPYGPTWQNNCEAIRPDQFGDGFSA